ncbi:LysR family transcriptional regulator [Halalkalibacterium halodurans]|nr:LysR family transcriptional regulator [Halalkalibacterium halodurans]
MSHAIKQLEETMEVQLFARHAKGVELTREGETIFPYIQQALGCIDKAEQLLQELKQLEGGRVTIGGSDSTFKYFVLPSIQRFQARYPNIHIRLQHGSTPQITEKLDNSSIDFGFVHLPVQARHVEIQPFLTISSLFVVGEQNRELAGRPLLLEEVLDYPLITFSESSSSTQFLQRLFERQGLHVQPDIEVGSVELLIECVKLGMGVAFVTKDFVLRELKKGELIPLEMKEPIEQRTIGIVKGAAVIVSC